MRLLGEYFAIGGMPEAVFTWINGQNLLPCIDIHTNILESYRQDFVKYSRKKQIKYVEKIFRETPGLVGRKFKYSSISGNYRARELRPALDLLDKGYLINKIYHSAANGLPLGAEANPEKFKLLFLDIGLMQTMLGNDTAPWIYDTYTTFVNKGQVAEAFVGQELLCYGSLGLKRQLHYWHREAKSSNAEVDYIISVKQEIIPIEVKSGAIGKNKSLDLFLRSHPTVPYGILMSPKNYMEKKQQICLPLYYIYALLDLAPP
ncbi:MAG: DUF4143 domain-containing protein [Deltaproteobacteria bacterium]|nr:DUF4143 domain-containing protein [Deltaproteobacteria bacterium]